MKIYERDKTIIVSIEQPHPFQQQLQREYYIIVRLLLILGFIGLSFLF